MATTVTVPRTGCTATVSDSAVTVFDLGSTCKGFTLDIPGNSGTVYFNVGSTDVEADNAKSARLIDSAVYEYDNPDTAGVRYVAVKSASGDIAVQIVRSRR